MEDKLISMVDFVLEQGMKKELYEGTMFQNCSKYAKLLKKQLQKSMFVPCGEDGEVINLPHSEYYMSCHSIYHRELNIYREAKELILFEGFNVIGKDCVLNSNIMIHFLNNKISIEEHFEEIITKLSKEVFTIEDLVKYNLTLTATALKQIER